MKKIKLFIIILICLFVVNVKADMGPPGIISHKVMVTNKNGAQCYINNEKGNKEKTKEIIPYKTNLEVFIDIDGSYINVTSVEKNEDGTYKYDCMVKYADVSAVNQNFNMNTNQVEKINTTKAIVLASGGINLRKGPSVTYSKLTTIPQYTVVTLTHNAGDHWYYTKYNGNSGWITGMSGYVGRESSNILYSNKAVKVYDSKGKNIGTIPANTPIEKYLVLDYDMNFRYQYYVIYNNIKGYVNDEMLIKLDTPGKIRLTKDYELVIGDGDSTKKFSKGREFEYTMIGATDYEFYIPEVKEVLTLSKSNYEYVKKANVSVKESGYLGEGLFGEKKEEKVEPVKPVNEEVEDPVIPEEENKGMSTKDIVIIGLLAGIFLALTSLVIIRLVNSKKKTVKEVDKKEEKINVVTDSEIERAREIIKREANISEPVIKREDVKLDEEINNIKTSDDE